jgi:hypothetical protein
MIAAETTNALARDTASRPGRLLGMELKELEPLTPTLPGAVS